jgi:hypothetical protein
MGKTARWAALLIMPVLLGGCKADSHFALFTSDIVAVARGGAPVPVSALYRVEISSKSDCEEKKTAIMAVVARYHEVSSAALCVEMGEDSWLEYSARTELVQLGQPLAGNAPLGVAARQAQTGDVVELYLVFDAARFAALQRDVSDLDLAANIDIGDLTLELMHDSATPQDLRGASAWVDGVARVSPQLRLTQADSVQLRMSDVLSAAMQAEGQALAFSLTAAP